jgi:uncharacterized protein (DUF885 family)
MRFDQRAFALPLLAVVCCPLLAGQQDKLRALFEEEWNFELRSCPECATFYGYDLYNDKLSDYSADAERARTEDRRRFLARFQAIDPAGLPAVDGLSRKLMIRALEEQIEGAGFKPWEMPIHQMGGPPLSAAGLVASTPFRNVADYEHYLARLQQIPRMTGQVIANIRQGMQDKLTPPRYLLTIVAAQAANLASTPDDRSPFTAPLRSFPPAIGKADRARLQAAILDAVHTRVSPAYQRFSEFVKREYVPQGRTDPGVWSLPDGAERYRFAVRQMTTTGMTPDEIHQIGLEQIAAIESEMLVLARKLGFTSVEALNAHIKSDRKLYATSGSQLLGLYKKYSDQMKPQLPKLFGRLPKTPLMVVPMEAYRAPNEVPADYSPGSEDGSRPGRINVNEYAPEKRLLLNVEAIAYHEGIPGHHLQFSIAHELQGVPAFRKHAEYTAFSEGWALYSEVLGKEIGFYQDPYSEYGRLENEMWRAIRLVVDTGVHSKHWSREQMVALFHKYTAMDEPNVQTEVDRYIAWPGQALAYKVGQLEILKARQEARQKLGPKFDLRAFHDAVLENGALPMDVLQAQIAEWIARRSSAN